MQSARFDRRRRAGDEWMLVVAVVSVIRQMRFELILRRPVTLTWQSLTPPPNAQQPAVRRPDRPTPRKHCQPRTARRISKRSQAPTGRTVNSQGREPLGRIPRCSHLSPNGAAVALRSPLRGSLGDRGRIPVQGLAPLAIDVRPCGAALGCEHLLDCSNPYATNYATVARPLLEPATQTATRTPTGRISGTRESWGRLAPSPRRWTAGRRSPCGRSSRAIEFLRAAVRSRAA